MRRTNGKKLVFFTCILYNKKNVLNASRRLRNVRLVNEGRI